LYAFIISNIPVIGQSQSIELGNVLARRSMSRVRLILLLACTFLFYETERGFSFCVCHCPLSLFLVLAPPGVIFHQVIIV
jgi:hypothetical protein